MMAREPAKLLAPLVGSLATFVGVSPAEVAVHVVPVPHPYPPGQHPPPNVVAQLLHPEAQLPVPRPADAAPMPLPVGATMVTPFVSAMVVEAVEGQSDSPQSRPTRQQPPW